MKRNLLLYFSVLTCYAFVPLQAQEPDDKFGKVDYDDAFMAIYEADTSAEAVVLYDRATTDFERMTIANSAFFQIKQVRHQRIKTLKVSALSRGIIKLPYYRTGKPDASQIIRDVKGATYNVENGKISEEKLDRKDITDEKGGEGFYVKQVSFKI